MIKEAINKLINKEKLSEVELRESFDEVFSGLATSVESASFISLINQFENETILSVLNCANGAIKKPFSIFNTDELIQNTAFNFDSKIIDVLLIQDLICATSGLNVARHCFDTHLTYENSFDVLFKMGINIKKEIDYSTSEYENLNFNYFYLSKESPYFKYSEPIRKALPFDNVFNYTHKLINPINAKNLFLGVNKKDDVEKYANIALKLNKANSIILCAQDGLPLVSLNGETCVAEAWKNKIFTYIVTPDLLGFKEASLEDLKCQNNEENAQDVLDIIQNKNKSPKYDLAIINSALALYISKKADSIMDGINLAKKLIEDGLVEQKYNQIKEFYL